MSCGGTQVDLIAVQVTPLCVSLSLGASQQFEATVFVNNVSQSDSNTLVTWSVPSNAYGTISNVEGSEGSYTAPNELPPDGNSIIITATSKSDSQKIGQATVLIEEACPVTE